MEVVPAHHVVRSKEVRRISQVLIQPTLQPVLSQNQKVTGEHVVAPISLPDGTGVGRPVDDLPDLALEDGHALLRLPDDRVVGTLGPILQQIVRAGGGTYASSDPPVGDGGNTLPVQGGSAAEHHLVSLSRLQCHGMVAPVDQIRTGDVRVAVPLFVLDDQHQVVAPLPEQGAVGIEGLRHPLGGHDVIGGPVGIRQEPCSELSGDLN